MDGKVHGQQFNTHEASLMGVFVLTPLDGFITPSDSGLVTCLRHGVAHSTARLW
jgi:hypothetical protein